MNNKLIIFSAPSGSGKTTIVHHVLERFPLLKFSISATSRNPRTGEKDGIDYYFLSPMEFRKKIEEGSFLEWEEVYTDQYYGTLRSEVERLWSDGYHVVFDVDVVGGLNLKKEFGSRALALFVMPPSLEVMEQRLRNRHTDTEEQLGKRIEKAAEELSYAPRFDVVLINDVLEKSFQEAVRLVKEFIR